MLADLLELVRYHDDQIASRSLHQSLGFKQSVVLYAMYQGETISNESSPEGKLLLVLEGRLLVSLTDQAHDMKAGGLISISAHQSYHLEATTNCKYLQIEMV
ncbi:acetate kinase [Streptococcus equi]|uniref:acetate kinase n=1 Tax=Streptococcus equi TaxID=1336 RepID=UPI0024A876F0|nr:acetate kinase [Streptococcus equi]MDI5953732.1 acetate kinase [Streptococcus equi subsp. zooepidemicus]HEL1204623.1 acetate kinase [Streptococcus equi subsp. zooepidemicus]HEL1350845.1 acetate kinase [Streptococcus equi subsp. zooepidemicus]